jgi:hypothetical protein
VFGRVARELCALLGQRERPPLDDVSTWAVDRAAQRVEGRTVELEIRVEPAFWLRFSET